MQIPDEIRHRFPPEAQGRIVMVTYGGRSYCFDTNPEASVEDDLRQVMDSFRRIHTNLDEDTADKVTEIFRVQIEEIKGREKPRREL
jgi:hypothetical protein